MLTGQLYASMASRSESLTIEGIWPSGAGSCKILWNFKLCTFDIDVKLPENKSRNFTLKQLLQYTELPSPV